MSPTAAILSDWRNNATKFAWDNFKFEPDKWQQLALDVLPSMSPEHMRIAMQACAGPGKSALLAIAGWYALACYGYKGHHPKGAAISITAQNLKDNLWAELSKWQSKSPYLMEKFEWTQQRIFAKDHPATWFLAAKSFSKTANVEEQGRTLSGQHSEYVFYLIDESGDIPVQVLRSAEQGLSGVKWGKIIQAGNPTSLDGMLYAAATTLKDKWFVIRITGDPDDPMRSSRIDIKWAREQIATWGRDNPWVMSFILGLFPPSSINTLLGPDEVAAAMNRHLTIDKYEWSQKRLGCDPARYGDDSTIIFPRQGLAAFKYVEMKNAPSNDIAARLISAKLNWKGGPGEMEFVDDTGGFGSGVIDNMRQAGYTPQAIHFASKAIDNRYLNKRSEMWFEMAQWVKRGGALPKCAKLAKELTTPTYTADKGQLILEPKDMIKKRLLFSPDRADALALTFALPDMPGTKRLPGGIIYSPSGTYNQGHEVEYDPYDSRRLKN